MAQSRFLYISRDVTLRELGELVGTRNLDAVLNLNSLPRVPNIGEVYHELCDSVALQYGLDEVPYQTKKNALDSLVDDADVFQHAANLDSYGWKVLATLSSFPTAIRIPENLDVSTSSAIMGTGTPITTDVYTKAISGLMSASHTIDPAIFNTYSNIRPSQVQNLDPNIVSESVSRTPQVFRYFRIPYTDVSLYSSLSNTYVDIPVYPEEVPDSHSATYNQMQEMLYQYEPWQVYASSGPRSNTYKFAFHRDMWGDHGDGQANKIIRFCQANCYPMYNGSAVHSATVTLYVKGKVLISGVLTQVDVNYSGPLGKRDNWYLMCELSLTIVEVSTTPLNFSSMNTKGVIG